MSRLLIKPPLGNAILLSLVFSLIFPQILAATEKPRQVAVVRVTASNERAPVADKLERALLRSFKEEGFSLVDSKTVLPGIERTLPKILEEETARAREAYYHFRFEEARRLLEGREDPEALKVMGLAALAEGEESEAEASLVRLLQREPKAVLSETEYPPRFRALFEKVLAERTQRSKGRSFLSIGKGTVLVDEESFESWSGRLRRLSKEMNWDFLLLYRIEEIGWNRKVSGYLFSAGAEPGFRRQVVEVTDPNDWGRAAKVLIRGLLSSEPPKF